MADIQRQFEQFDDEIRLTRLKENKELIQKRDVILDKLRKAFAQLRGEGQTVPTFEFINQGSYEMGTGIHPAEGQDYDIDVGLKFNCAKGDYPNPVDLKELVAKALEDHTDLGTEIRRSCVTVKYTRDGEQAFHVDLAVYAYDNPDHAWKRLFIAKGKLGADEKNRAWEESDPDGLIDWVEKRFTGKEQDQFLRIIRALKRWKTEKFKTDGQNAPTGIGLTVAAGEWFRPCVNHNAFAVRTRCDDLEALSGFVATLVSKFYVVGTKQDGTPLYRLTVPVPVAPGADIFMKMSHGQMTTFRERLLQIKEKLDKATRDPDAVTACQTLRGEFGPLFPVPEKSSTASSGGRAVAGGGISA
ncbi:nucleotidyltransferase [Corallococcus sp. AB032C]|uniref:nucleotidyltransferase domain-containing protein n=1 Tax=Corallococcus TaxID=83461 RepID=UPI000EDE7E28|nr:MULTISPECIES: nucleotidyltransferase [Corallococcus]NPC48732.1 nucleotidyltransferase [Corallococcus exiguus]RKH80180.1 nucleotidyltransferase [Corallococcus sp. AB032C]